jgi:hypothetical protein
MSASATLQQQVETVDLQHLVDQVAGFHVFVTPDVRTGSAALRGEGGATIGLRASASLRRFEAGLEEMPSARHGVRAINVVGEPGGRVELRWLAIPYGFLARPDREPPATPLDPSRSQRLALQETTFFFGDGRDGFRSFGAGRTFPYEAGGKVRLWVAAIGNLTGGFGRLRDCEGNFTACGELDPERGFVGHMVVRLLDPGGTLRTARDLPLCQPSSDPDPESTYLVFGAQKGEGADQENRFSLTPEGEVRGLNIPTRLKTLDLAFEAPAGDGFRGRDFRLGPTIGREVGFGRGSDPAASPAGTALQPFFFEGVARYAFHDEAGFEVGALITNILEGRRFDVRLAGAPGETAWRFGFFGPVVASSGCFQGVQGMFYGASGSILHPPPGKHYITHFYVARLHDPEGRFRSRRGC